MKPSANARQSAFYSAIATKAPNIVQMTDQFGKEIPVSEYFGCQIFGLAQMREKLTKDAYNSLLKTLDAGKKLPKETAEAIASAVKEWSVSKGVTHFSTDHSFTAEAIASAVSIGNFLPISKVLSKLL